MKDGIGEGRTRKDHAEVAAQLFASYARVKQIRALEAIVGAEECSETDKVYLRFGARFEREFLSQAYDEDRTVEQTLDIGWRMLSILPQDELYRVSKEDIRKYYKPSK
jgi:V/A-type H+-transporting ATPase subunit B